MEVLLSLIFPVLVALFIAVAALSWGSESRPVFDERHEDERFGALR
jgi:nitrogen fixation-related uncharacterized protein